MKNKKTHNAVDKEIYEAFLLYEKNEQHANNSDSDIDADQFERPVLNLSQIKEEIQFIKLRKERSVKRICCTIACIAFCCILSTSLIIKKASGGSDLHFDELNDQRVCYFAEPNFVYTENIKKAESQEFTAEDYEFTYVPEGYVMREAPNNSMLVYEYWFYDENQPIELGDGVSVGPNFKWYVRIFVSGSGYFSVYDDSQTGETYSTSDEKIIYAVKSNETGEYIRFFWGDSDISFSYGGHLEFDEVMKIIEGLVPRTQIEQ